MDEHTWAEQLASRLGVDIPPDIRINYWMLPLLDKIVYLLEDRDILNESNNTKNCIYKSSRRPVKQSEVE